MQIETKVEGARGCGYRKPGGLYFITMGPGRPCGKLPLPLSICPCCGEGIRRSRAMRWVDAGALFKDVTCRLDNECGCPLEYGHDRSIGQAVLLWVGEKFYPDTATFQKEANTMGVSRRITAVPRGFMVGEDWVLLAHPKAILEFGAMPEVKYRSDGKAVNNNPAPGLPGIFYVFKPERIEYVVKGDETEEKLEDLVKRGITPVKVEKAPPVRWDTVLDDREKTIFKE